MPRSERLASSPAIATSPQITAATASRTMQTAVPTQAQPQPLSLWLRLLWGATPTLHLDSEAPFIAGGCIHLPARPVWQQHCAAAAHAAAHLIYSPARFEADGLVPIARCLLALLEDARVEALAMRELPGLARLWRPLHTATPADGQGCEALLGRLSRALADPGYDDPDPWVAKGRRLFYLDEALGLPALRTPAELRGAAMRLGHDIGQMRLPFNHRGYRPAPAYRDDHRWMWAADQLAAVQTPPQPEPTPADAAPPRDEPEPAASGSVTLHPEWDRLIQRLRPDWCRVIEADTAPAATPPQARPDPSSTSATRTLARRLLAPLRSLTRPLAGRSCSADGDAFDLDALVSWQMARRSGQAPDARLYRARQRQAARTAVWLLVDRSASTAAPASASAPASGQPSHATNTNRATLPLTVLQAAASSAAATALALQSLGVPCAVVAFSSHGRHAVHWQTVKALGQAVDDTLVARLQALRSGGSTRLGAALRHATARLGAHRGTGGRATGWVLLLSDGEPHDVDVHDPRYLVDDARHAVRDGQRRAVRMTCLTLGGAPAPQALRIFGRHGTQALAEPAALPRALRRLVA